MTKSPEQPFRYIGKDHVRRDGKEKITGAAIYVDDIDFGSGLLYAAVVESPHAHAIIKKIDTSAAEKLPGVVRVVKGSEFPYRFGLYMHDRYIFAQDRVRFVGEQVAAVIARDPATAKRAAKLVQVEYKVLKPILKLEDAIDFTSSDRLESPCREKIHPELQDYTHVPWFFPKPDTNIAHFRKIRRGDLEAGFKSADFIFEDEFEMPRYAHCSIETHAAVGKLDHSGRLTLWTASQSPHTQRHLFAQALAPLGFTHQDIRVITPNVGGGFGGKAGVSMEILAAALATTVKGHPVKVLWSREQEFYNTYQRQGVKARLRMGVKKDGTIVALDETLLWDAGAYVEYGANVVNAAGLSAAGPYRIENLKIDSVCVYTNLPPGGPYRGFGYSEFIYGLESMINDVAKKIGMDPIAFRLHNAIREGDTLAYGAKMNPNGLTTAIEQVRTQMDWDNPEILKTADPSKVIGRGFSLFWKAPAMPPNASSSCFLKFNEDASINLLISAMEIGQGYWTVMAQIAAEVLGVPPEKIRSEFPDTDRNPYEWQTVASHITWSCGNAVRNAAIDARDQIFDLVERALGKNRDALYLENEQVRSREEPQWSVPLRDFIIEGFMMKDGTWRGGPIVGRGMFMPEFASALSDPQTGQGGKPNVHYTVGAAGLTLEIDRETGKMHVKKCALAVDCGQALNPSLVRGQITGGILQGLATVLYEDMRFSPEGRLLNPNFTDYKIPTSMDIPDEIIPIIVEVPQPDGPFGARGMGEHTMIPAAPMVGNAIEEALGIRIRSMPMTAEKVWTHLQKRD